MKDRSEGFSVELNQTIYSLNAIRNAAYDFSGKTWVIIQDSQNGIFKVSLTPKDSKHFSDSIQFDFINHVLDHQIRLDIEKEFKTIREMIVAQAFEPCENLKEVVDELFDE